MMLGKLQAASKYVTRLRRKHEKLENSGSFVDLGHGREIRFQRLEVSSRNEFSRKEIGELREVIRSGLARQYWLDQSTSFCQCSSMNYDKVTNSVPHGKANGLNITANLTGLELEETCSKPVQRKLQDMILQQQKPEIDTGMPKLKKLSEPEVQDYELDGRTLKEILENVQFRGLLKSNLIIKTPVFGADNVPPVVLIKPSGALCPGSSDAMIEGEGASKVLKSLKANEKFSSERTQEKPRPKEFPGVASRQKRGPRCSEEEISAHEKARNSERDSNKLGHPSPPVEKQVKKEKHGKKSGEIGKVAKSRRGSPEKANLKARSMHQSEDQVKANASVTVKPEDRLSRTKKEVSPQGTQNSRQDQTKKEVAVLEMQRGNKMTSNQQTRTSSQSCGDLKGRRRKKPLANEPKQLTAAKLDKNNASQGENENASESGVVVSETCSGIASSPTSLSPMTTEPGIEANGQKSSLKGIEIGDHMKLLLLSSPSFLPRAEDLLMFVSDPPAPLQEPKIVDSIFLKEKLLVDYANEFMKCRTSSPLVVGLWSLRKISLDNLLEEILEGIETLTSYCKLASESLLMDGLNEKLKRDLSLHQGGAVSKLWDAGWTRGFCWEDAEYVVSEVEETVLSSLIEETLTEILQ